MNQRIAKKTIRLLASLGVIATVTLSIYAAQPWGDNDAYQDISGYLLLTVFVAWAISPYAYLFRSAGRHSPNRMSNLFRVAVTLLICIGGIAVVFDTVFIHPDAQGGLVFILLPVYQWLVIGVLKLILVSVRPKNAI